MFSFAKAEMMSINILNNIYSKKHALLNQTFFPNISEFKDMVLKWNELE